MINIIIPILIIGFILYKGHKLFNRGPEPFVNIFTPLENITIYNSKELQTRIKEITTERERIEKEKMDKYSFVCECVSNKICPQCGKTLTIEGSQGFCPNCRFMGWYSDPTIDPYYNDDDPF